MRLGTCIALELAVVAGAIVGVVFGVGYTIEIAGDYLSTQDASAAPRRGPGASPGRLPSGSLAVNAPSAPESVFGASDASLLEPIGAAPITRVKINNGGTSLSLRIDFANGSRALFKPEQIHPQSDPRREVAAFRMDRLLGIGHVAPAKPIKLVVADMVTAADPQFRTYTARRIEEEAKPRAGELRGMVAWWIPEIRDAKLSGVHMHEPGAIAELMSYLQIGAPIPTKVRGLVEQFATCIVFDSVIDNSDRWSGSNTKTSPDGNTLYFMDNALAFSRAQFGHERNVSMLRRMQVFPRGLITRLRALRLEHVIAALDLGEDRAGLGPLLAPEEIRAIIARRDHVLEHVDSLIKQYGEDAVLALP